jgi:hypothetical protein
LRDCAHDTTTFSVSIDGPQDCSNSVDINPPTAPFTNQRND